MATETRPVQMTGTQGEQLALTTTVAALGVPYRDGSRARGVLLKGSADFRWHLNPALKGVLKTQDNGATYTVYTKEATDRNTATVVTLNSQGTAAQGDMLYLFGAQKFGGFTADVGNTNSTASVMTVNYWNGTAWADASATDGTASGGATLAQDGNVTLTPAADWTEKTIHGVTGYPLQIVFSAALDSSVTIRELALLNQDANRAYGYSGALYSIPLGSDVGAIEALVAADTATLDLTWLFGNTLPMAALGSSGSSTGASEVTVTAALPSGTNNIGDVDVLSIAAGTNNIGGTTDAGASWTTSVGVTGAAVTSADASAADAAVTDAPTSGQKIVVDDIICSSDTKLALSFKEETSGTLLAKIFLPADGSAQLTTRGKLKLATADRKLVVRASAAGNIAVTVLYHSEA
jgi:hypothetical protein